MDRMAVVPLTLIVCAMSAAMAFAAAPIITDVSIERGRDTDAPDWASYHQHVFVTVSDADGAGDIASVTITDPSGDPYTITPAGGGAWWSVDATTIGCSLNQDALHSAPSAGAYSITTTDSAANFGTLVTPSAPAVSETHPVLTAPAIDAVITDASPTFQWTAGLAGSTYALTLNEEGSVPAIWSVDMGAATEADYNFDASASQSALQANHTYVWALESYRAEDDRVTDLRVSIVTTQLTRGRFTVYGAWSGTPPSLSGQLAYSAVFWASDGWSWSDSDGAILAYGSDPSTREWLSPLSANYPDWSPDGTKLLYAKDGGVWVDPLDGSPALQVPGVTGGDCRWASDSGRVVYATQGSPSPHTPSAPGNFDVWVSNLDGSHQYPLADSIYHDERWPAWSPDGLWVAYRKLPSTDGSSLWLIRYDSTEDHPLLATGVEGYPDYSVTYMGEHCWSPDGTTLVVNFGADYGAESIGGIGLISREGGTVTPVFIAPAGVICCASPHLPEFSPDGTQVVFTSGHHLSVLPGVGDFSTGGELYLANADGSGAPTRLTYDSSFSYYASWWDRNTEAGEDIAVTKGDTTVTFDEVTEDGNTSVTVYEEPIDLPYNFEFCEDQYQIATTAEVAGPITICMAYDEADIPSGASEASLCLLHYNEAGDYWEDITVSRDPVTNTICGETTSLSVFVVASAPTSIFSDVPAYGLGPYGTEGYWAFYEIGACADAGVVGGYNDGSYQPTWSVTRSQMAVFIARSTVSPTGEDGVTAYEPPSTPSFTDVPTSYWAYRHIELLADQGIVAGYPDGYYRPTVTVTRDQMAVYIARAIADPKGEEGLAGYVPPETASFSDLPTDHWAYKYVEYVADEGIVQGYPDGFYRPQRRVTRDQMAVYVARAFGLL